PRLQFRCCRHHAGCFITFYFNGYHALQATTTHCLNERSSRGVILNKNSFCRKPLCQSYDLFHEIGELELFAKDMDQVIFILVANLKGQTHGIVAGAGSLQCSVPTLDYFIAELAGGKGILKLQPVPLEQIAAFGKRRLQILSIKNASTHLRSLCIEVRPTRVLLVQDFILLPLIRAAIWKGNADVARCDGW